MRGHSMDWRTATRVRAPPGVPRRRARFSRYARRVPSPDRKPRSLRGPGGYLLCLATSALIALSASPAALATNLGGAGSLGELAQSQQETTTTRSVTTTAKNEVTNSSSVVVLALVAAVLLLSVIAFVIIRDARRRAPAEDADLIEARSAHDQSVRMRKRRAKAKAARKQRKRTR